MSSLKPNLGWKTLSSKSALKDKWISVRADTCLTQEGVRVDPYYVLEYCDWVHIIALTLENEFVFTRQYRHGIGSPCIELPCGHIDSSDPSPEEAARRELIEETGFDGASFFKIGEFSQNPATHSNRVHCVLAKGVSKTKIPMDDPTERIEVLVCGSSGVRELIRSGQFLQGLHIASLALALSELGLSSEVF